MSQKVLVIDDEIQFIDSISPFLEMENHKVLAAMTATQGLDLLEREAPTAIILDVRLPGHRSGVDLINAIRSINSQIPIIMVSGLAQPETIVQAIKAGATDYIQKPFDADILLDKLRDVVAAPEGLLAANNQTLNRPCLIGNSPAILKIKEDIRRIAQSHAPVLITGESGAGKSLIARLIHEAAAGDKPFLAVNCGSNDADALERELAALSAQMPEAATVVSLFLEEVCDMGHALQARLLKFLEDHDARRLGDRRPPVAGPRIISSTFRQIANRGAGGLREDLYYRLNVLTLHIPPLRERKEDIQTLAEHFVKKYAQRESRTGFEIPGETLRRFAEYNWPGNVRELENVIERAVVFTAGEQLKDEDFRLNAPLLSAASGEGAEHDVSVTDIEKKALVDALEESGGNISKAAKKLSLSRDTIYRRMSKYHIPIKKDFRAP